jgi:hypothetical protein
MISPVAAVLLVALVFYVVIPGIGAFGVRQRWRSFRRRVVQASLRPPVTYAAVREMRSGGEMPAPARFLGTLESIQGEHTAWLRGSDLTIAVDMSQSDVFMVPHVDLERGDVTPTRTSWARLGSLPEGMKVLVSGHLDASGAHPTIRAVNGEPVLVIFYDGDESSLVRRCTWAGRQLNEYWNSVTPGALAGGTLALIVVAYLLLRQPISSGFARLSIALSSIPILPLLPPGVAFFYLYRRSWRRGRVLRAHRDVLHLPLRHFSGEERCTRLPNGELHCRRTVDFNTLDGYLDHGLTLLAAPVSAPSSHCTLFGRPQADELVAPSDSLTEWVAVRGDPASASEMCQRSARRFEMGSAAILSAGLLVNFVLVAVVLRYVL